MKVRLIWVSAALLVGAGRAAAETADSYQRAIDNFAKLNSFTFKGSAYTPARSPKSSPTEIKFSGGFVEAPVRKCSIIESIAGSEAIFSKLEYRILGRIEYQRVKQSRSHDPASDDIWEQLSQSQIPSLYAFEQLSEGQTICDRRLPALVLFKKGALKSSAGNEDVYSLDFNKGYFAAMAGDLAGEGAQAIIDTLADIVIQGSGGKAPKGTLVIDTRTMLPKRISIASAATSRPLFEFDVVAVNASFDVQIPENPLTSAMIASERQKPENRLRSLIGTVLEHITQAFAKHGSYGTAPNQTGNCNTPAPGSLFSKTGHPGQSAEDDRNAYSYSMIAYHLGLFAKMAPTAEIYCYSTPERYAIEAKIPGERSYICVDSAGTKQELPSKISGPSCR